MGLFNFIKNIGKKPPEGQDLRETLDQAVTKAGLNIQNFKVEVKKGEAILSGSAATQKDLELARLIAGNFKGVEKVNDDQLKVVPQTAQTDQTQPLQQESPARMVTVKEGDTLSKLAREHLGDEKYYPQIFDANRPMLKDPDEIFPGQVLRIPEVSGSQEKRA